MPITQTASTRPSARGAPRSGASRHRRNPRPEGGGLSLMSASMTMKGRRRRKAGGETVATAPGAGAHRSSAGTLSYSATLNKINIREGSPPAPAASRGIGWSKARPSSTSRPRGSRSVSFPGSVTGGVRGQRRRSRADGARRLRPPASCPGTRQRRDSAPHGGRAVRRGGGTGPSASARRTRVEEAAARGHKAGLVVDRRGPARSSGRRRSAPAT